jgi:asparagine synthase (glutamine-hydrolysing)
MFRFIGIHWNLASPSQAALADQLAMTISARPDWQHVHRSTGLRVFTTGTSAGVNEAYALRSGQGVILGRLFRRGGTPPKSASPFELTETAGHRIVHTDGQALIEEFWGRYVAFLPSWTGECRVLRDPTGALPCYQLQFEGLCILFCWLEDLVEVLKIAQLPSVDWEAVAALLLFNRLGGQDTALDGVRQILPGVLTSVGQQANSPLTLWDATSIAGRDVELEPAIAARQLRETVVTCVQSWASCYDTLLLRLSGGVDSAILLGSLCPALAPSRVTCLNYHSPGSDSDERTFARLAAKRAGTALVERTRDTDFRLQEVLDVARTPIPGGYVGRMGTGRMDAATAAAHHARAMFTGAGGDQLFFELRCTWPASDYLKLHGVGPGFLKAALDSARLGRVSLWQAIKSAFAERRFARRPDVDTLRHVTLMPDEAVHAASLQHERFTHSALRDAAGLPIGKFHQLQELIHPFECFDPYLREAAPELVNPLLSQPVIEFCLATPLHLLTHGGRGRALARMAFADDIPREIATRRSKGGMEEHITTILQRNLAFVRELLLDGNLVGHGLLDRKRLEGALAGRPSAMDAHVMEIHTYVALEAWTRRFTDSAITS